MNLVNYVLITSALGAAWANAAEPSCGWQLTRWQGEVSYEARAGGLLSTFSGEESDLCEARPPAQIKPIQASVIKYRMDRLTLEIARGEGDSLRALAALYTIPANEHTDFGLLLKQHYHEIFPSAATTLQQAYTTIDTIIQQSPKWAKPKK
jgi:hypothetical protein